MGFEIDDREDFTAPRGPADRQPSKSSNYIRSYAYDELDYNADHQPYRRHRHFDASRRASSPARCRYVPRPISPWLSFPKHYQPAIIDAPTGQLASLDISRRYLFIGGESI